MKNAGKACNNRLYRHIRTFEKIVKNYFVILYKICNGVRKKVVIINYALDDFDSILVSILVSLLVSKRKRPEA